MTEQDFNEFFGDPTVQGASELMMSIVQDSNQCAANLITKYDLKQEVKELLDVVFSEAWLQTVEFGSQEDFKEELAIAIDPLTSKVLEISGADFAATMSFELSEWIKDTTLLWIKNKGAGQTTTEAEIKRIAEMKRHQEVVDELKLMYQKKMAEQAVQFQEKAAQLAKVFQTRQAASEAKLLEKIEFLEEENRKLKENVATSTENSGGSQDCQAQVNKLKGDVKVQSDINKQLLGRIQDHQENCAEQL